MPSDKNHSIGVFPVTRWSLVQTSNTPESFEIICSMYWRPVYGFLRRNGHSREDAEDLTQSFFAELLKDESLNRVQQEKGKLRSFLLGSLKRHLGKERRYQDRQKRGGGAVHLPLATSEMDFQEAEHQYAAQPLDELSPDRVFEQRWAIELLMRAHRRLHRDYEAAGKEKEFLLLKPAVDMVGEVDAVEVAKKLGVKEASVRVLVYRIKKNFRAAFKDEIAETVAGRGQVEEEYQRLLQVFS